MNHIYRLIWCDRTNALIPVAETVRGRGKFGGKSKAVAAAVAGALMVLGSEPALAADVCSGSATTTISTGLTTDNCVLDSGGSLVVTSGGSIDYAGRAVSVSSAAGSISNSGTISGSSAIYLSGDTITQIINNAGGTISGSTQTGIVAFNSSTITGGITNSGMISGGRKGIYAETSSVLAGGIHNLAGGTITGSTGILLSVGVQSGGVTNSGLIEGTNGVGLYISDSTISGAIHNLAGGTISGVSKAAVLLSGGASVTGGIKNEGLIKSDDLQYGSHAIFVSSSTVEGGISNSGTILAGGYSGGGGIGLSSSTVVGGINNSGTISVLDSGHNHYGYNLSGIFAASSLIENGITNSGLITIAGETSSPAQGIYLSDTSVSGNIVNSGTISAYAASTSANGIFLSSATINGGIVNSGTIAVSVPSGTGAGIWVTGGSIGGGITNSGLIDVEGSSAIGLKIDDSGTVINGGITNSGQILANATSATAIGLNMADGTIVGNIVNTGQIQASGGSDSFGVQLSGGTVTGALINSAGGTISGTDAGVKVTGTTLITDGINNAGLISGTTKSLDLQNTTNPITVNNTGTLQGNVYLGNAGNTLNLNGNSARVIGDVTNEGASSTVNINGTFTSEGLFDVGNVNVNDGGLFNWTTPAHTITANALTVNSGGILNVGNSTQTLNGDYVQSGIFRMGLVDAVSNYGKVVASGNASVAGGIDVVMSGTPLIANGTTVAGVIQSTGMTATPADITVTDNNLFYDFTAAKVTDPINDLDLIVAVDSNALPNAVSPDNPAAQGAAQALQDIFNQGVGQASALRDIFNAGAPAAWQPVFDALGTMSPAQINTALLQLTPAMQGAFSQAGLNALHGMNRIIQSRVESVQGLNSGDAASDQYAWSRVFGNWGEQENIAGVPGFTSSTQGFAIGMDLPLFSRIRAGSLFSYANTNLKSNVPGANVNVDTFEIAAYGSYNIDPQTDINVQLDLGMNNADSSRRIDFMGSRANAKFDSLTWHISTGIGHLFQLGASTNLTPSLRADYAQVHTDSYTETGAGVLNQHIGGSKYEEALLVFDSKLSQMLTDNGLKMVVNGSAGYDFINQQSKSISSFTGGGPTFVTNGLEVSPWLFRGGFGLIKETDDGLEFSARYDMETRTSGYLNQTASVKVRWSF